MKRLLLVWHSRSGLARAMADELERGAVAVEMEVRKHESTATPLLALERRAAAEATVSDVLAADGFLFCAPENLASVSGEMKEFFDRSYYPGASIRMHFWRSNSAASSGPRSARAAQPPHGAHVRRRLRPPTLERSAGACGHSVRGRGRAG
eukprot:SAG11_NODE_2535_length_3245_cov_11.597584_3_plen_151_part_00